MSSKDYIYCYQGKGLRIAGSTAVIGSTYKDPPAPSFDEVTIGSQTWMSKNLTIDDGQGGIYSQTVNYGQGDVVEYYYTWDAAVRVAATVQGWHLPSDSEWATLVNSAGGSFRAKNLKSTYGWTSGNGIDKYNFSVFPAGTGGSGSFNGLGSTAFFLTATETSELGAYIRRFTTGSGIYSEKYEKAGGYSVRLMKDAE
jgi:uncharacterized protein (TIGR02145 family)